MPNGGSNCCANCEFNHARGELGLPRDQSTEAWAEFFERSFCVLRRVRTPDAYETYCGNFVGVRLLIEDSPDEPTGPIFASGLYEGYTRIPWHGDVAPQTGVPVTCAICGRRNEEGISIAISESESLGFCTNRHYVEWWKTVHDDPRIRADGLATPEEYFREKGALDQHPVE